ncbi:hypothetical protein GALL_495960 [mine drainage metagenome]|uniref:Uncharacterized protein n=1 Tax=mine drainage metagenome TaxID=410659 RepID=A0A1J5PDG3_9ZZZZ
MFVLAHQCRRGDLGDHQAGVEAGVGRQERRQVKAERRVNHQRHAALSDGADFRDGERDHIGGETDGFGVEVATRDDEARLCQHQRVVGGGVRLDLQGASGHAQHVHRGTGDLGLAADAIGVLHAGVALTVAFADLAAVEQGAHEGGGLDLARVAAQGVDFGLQRGGGAHDGVGGHRRGNERGLRGVPRTEQARERVGGGELRAVDEGEAFFGAKRDRVEARGGERLGSRQDCAADFGLTRANQHGCHVGEGGEVARRADRSLGRDDGRDTARQHVLQQLDQLPPHAGRAAPEAEEFQRHHQAGGGARDCVAHAAAMRQDQVALQGGSIFWGDSQGRQLAKAGVHPVDRHVASGSSVDCGSGSLDPRTGSAVQRDGQFLAVDARQLRQGGLAGNKDKSGQRTPPIMRW